jgi:hypothetical protein
LILPKLTIKSTDEEITAEIASVVKLPYIAALKGGTLPVVQGGRSSKEDDTKRHGTAWA